MSHATAMPALSVSADLLHTEVPDAAWRQILARDPAADGCFVYGVRSTGIFCRPTCASRRPLRSNAMLFGTPAAAAAEGFRACLRCRPELVAAPAGAHSRIVERATELLRREKNKPVAPARLARVLGVSSTALRRAFEHVLGVTPAEFLRADRLNRLRAELHPATPESSAPVTTALQNAGFASPSRLYEQSGATLGMTPTSLRRGGAAEAILYTIAESPLGRTLVATTERGVCAIQFGDTDAQVTTELRGRFPRADLTFVPESGGAGASEAVPERWLAEAVRFVLVQLTEHPLAATFPTDVRATAFQHRVWAALQGIPRGETLTYAGLAERLGKPTGARAVAAACARNPLALANPCHRVVGSSGALTGYRWGLERKRQILDAERAGAEKGGQG